MTAYVYLLHFDQPYPGGRRPQHYLGVAVDPHERFLEHQNGSSKSRLTRACAEKGIPVQLARTWKHDYPKAAFDRERKIKQLKRSYSHLCPLCKELQHASRPQT